MDPSGPGDARLGVSSDPYETEISLLRERIDEIPVAQQVTYGVLALVVALLLLHQRRLRRAGGTPAGGSSQRQDGDGGPALLLGEARPLPGATITRGPVVLSGDTMHRGVLGLGMPGSGKTQTLIYPAILAAVSWGRSALVVLDPKGDLCAHVLEAARQHGRSSDVRVLRVGGPLRWNPLGSLGPRSSVREIRQVATDLVQSRGGATSADRYWDDQASTLLAYILQLLSLSGEEVSFDSALALATRLGPSGEEHRLRLYARAARHGRASDLARTQAYLEDEYQNIADKTRSIITSVVTVLLRLFDLEEYRQTFGGRSGDPDQMPTMEEVVDRGLVVVVDLRPVEDAAIASTTLGILKAAYRRAVLTRDRRGPVTHPTVLVMDEYQQVAHGADGDLLELGRSSKSVVVAASQQLASIRGALASSGGQDAAQRVIGGFPTLISLRHADPSITARLRELVGEWETQEVSTSQPAALLPGWQTTSRRPVRHQVVTAELMRSLGQWEAIALVEGQPIRIRCAPHCESEQGQGRQWHGLW